MPEPDCPECGNKVAAVGGQFPSTCPSCQADLTKYEEEFKAKMSAGMPGAPGVPAPPGAPGVPKAPGAPGAPKSPGAPKAPGA